MKGTIDAHDVSSTHTSASDPPYLRHRHLLLSCYPNLIFDVLKWCINDLFVLRMDRPLRRCHPSQACIVHGDSFGGRLRSSGIMSLGTCWRISVLRQIKRESRLWTTPRAEGYLWARTWVAIGCQPALVSQLTTWAASATTSKAGIHISNWIDSIAHSQLQCICHRSLSASENQSHNSDRYSSSND